MDIVFSHKTALQICAQLKINGNEDVFARRTSKDFRATYSACSDEDYEKKLRFLKDEYGVVLSQDTHELLRNNSRTRERNSRLFHQFNSKGSLINLGESVYCVTPALAICLLSRKQKTLHQIVLTNLLMATYGHLPNGELCAFSTPLLRKSELASMLEALNPFSLDKEKHALFLL